MREKTERLEAESLGYRRTADEAETSAEEIKSERRGMQGEVHLLRTHNESMVQHLINSMTLYFAQRSRSQMTSAERGRERVAQILMYRSRVSVAAGNNRRLAAISAGNRSSRSVVESLRDFNTVDWSKMLTRGVGEGVKNPENLADINFERSQNSQRKCGLRWCWNFETYHSDSRSRWPHRRVGGVEQTPGD